jgi:hypothetical protein
MKFMFVILTLGLAACGDKSDDTAGSTEGDDTASG